MIVEKKEKQECESMYLEETEKNEMEVFFDAKSENEGFARLAVSAFIASMNPTLEEIADIKTAVSEAVTNAIIHGYENLSGYSKRRGNESLPLEQKGKVRIYCTTEDGCIYIEVCDWGKGIENVKQALEPLYTTKPELERSGMGFAFMEAFMDELKVESIVGKGTKVIMKKELGMGWIDRED